jgi:hypothetical protein
MKRAATILLDYLVNALLSGCIGLLVAAALTIVLGSTEYGLAKAGLYALVGVVCGSCSKATIEGSFYLFGAHRLRAYLLNAAIIALIILAFCFVRYGGLGGLPLIAVVSIFALPEMVSAILVRRSLDEADGLERAFARKRTELEALSGDLPEGGGEGHEGEGKPR